MAHLNSHLSTTLPRNFQFHYSEDQHIPQTPEPQEQSCHITEPPPPPKQTFKIRRRRTDNTHDYAPESSILLTTEIIGAGQEAAPLPTIEMTEPGEGSSAGAAFESSHTPGYLAPRPSHLRIVSPPRTPASQVTSFSEDDSSSCEWDLIHNVRRDRIERPRSACSNFSDSSATSFGSSNASNSLGGGSCTSPESDATDAFSMYELKSGPAPALGLPSSSDLPTAKRAKTNRHPKWTAEMDDHVWITYMIYVQDPRVTPFKMLPGTAPPLGVCHRVAREAKRSWKGQRAPLSQLDRNVPRISIQGPGSPDAIYQAKGGDRSTPTPTDHRPAAALRWPRSEAATRRRLRDLCKRKPSLSAHYMRLLRTRSPSPFESSSSSPRQQGIPTPETSAFSSRDMNVSLVAATAPSMQANGPLAQLSRETPAMTPAPAAPAVQRPTDWFARIGRSHARAQAHQKSQSLQLGLGLNTWPNSNNNSFERGSILDSPFDNDVSRDSFLSDMSNTQSLDRGFLNRQTQAGNPLRSPLDLDGPMPTARSLKRRFGVDEESTPQPSLQNLFAAPPTPASSRPMMRNRGSSLSDMGAGSMNTPAFFKQSPLPDHIMEEAPEVKVNTGYLTAPRSQHPPRLGSPFGGSSTPQFNTFPRCVARQEREGQTNPFEERLRQLSAANQNI